VDPVPDPLLLRKSGSAGNRTRDLLVWEEGEGTDYKEENDKYDKR
jgi:hypothetical protein